MAVAAVSKARLSATPQVAGAAALQARGAMARAALSAQQALMVGLLAVLRVPRPII